MEGLGRYDRRAEHPDGGLDRPRRGCPRGLRRQRRQRSCSASTDCCARPTPPMPRTTTSCSPARWSTRSWTTTPEPGWCPTSSVPRAVAVWRPPETGGVDDIQMLNGRLGGARVSQGHVDGRMDPLVKRTGAGGLRLPHVDVVQSAVLAARGRTCLTTTSPTWRGQPTAPSSGCCSSASAAGQPSGSRTGWPMPGAGCCPATSLHVNSRRERPTTPRPFKSG